MYKLAGKDTSVGGPENIWGYKDEEFCINLVQILKNQDRLQQRETIQRWLSNVDVPYLRNHIESKKYNNGVLKPDSPPPAYKCRRFVARVTCRAYNTYLIASPAAVSSLSSRDMLLELFKQASCGRCGQVPRPGAYQYRR
jgi:hypothetical protein